MRITMVALVGMVGIATWNGCSLDTNGLGGGGGSLGTSSSTAASSSGSTSSSGSVTSSSSGQTSTSTSGSSSSTSSSSSSGCSPGTMQACYTGPSGTDSHMPCHGGMATCQQDHTFGTCMGEQLPVAENCASGLDQNCDGKMSMCTGATGTGGKALSGGADKALAIAIDTSSNVIVGGFFGEKLDFGGGNVTNVGGQDSFVAKYDNAAAFKWVQHFGASGSGQMGPQQVSAVAVDAAGDVFVTGTFTNGIVFPPSTSGMMGGPGIFVAKLDPTNGNVIWGKAFTAGDGMHPPFANGIAVSSDGTQIAVVGRVSGTTTIGTPAITTSDVTNPDGVLFTLDGSGTVVWAKQLQDATNDVQSLHAVAIEASGNIAVTGHAAGNADFGDGKPVTAPAIGNGELALAAAVYKKDGSAIVWKKLYGGSAVATGTGVAFGKGGDVFVTGTFAGSIDVGGTMTCTVSGGCSVGNCDPVALTCPNLTAQGNFDIVVTRLAGATGAPTWAKTYGAMSQDDEALGIAADAFSVVVSGYFQGPLTADNTPKLTAVNGRDALVMKLDADGNALWTKQFGDMGDDKAQAVAIDPDTMDPPGSSAIAGYFKTKVDVGGGAVSGAGNTNIFFARLGP